MKQPDIHKDVHIARGAVVLGDVTIGKDSSIWYNAVVRGDVQKIMIGEGTNIQDNAVLHVDAESPLSIGDYVTVGHGAILHGCTIGDRVLVGMGAIILNGAVIGEGSIIGAGALVTQNMVIPDHSLVLGSPGKVRREVSAEEEAANQRNAENYIRESKTME